MISTFSSKLKTQNLLQITITENILTQNFLLIASQFDRLQNHHNMIQNNILSKIQAIQKNLEAKIKEIISSQNLDSPKIPNQLPEKNDTNKTILVNQMRILKQKMNSEKDKQSDLLLQMQKQINKVLNETNTIDLRLETLQKYLKQNEISSHIEQNSIKKTIQQQNKQNVETPQNPSNKKIKKIQEQQKKIYAKIEELQNQIKSKFRNNKKYVNSNNTNSKQTQVQEIKTQQSANLQNQPNEIIQSSQDQQQQFRRQTNFKFQRIQNQNIKILKNIKQLQQQIQKNQESLYSVIQKLKSNQTNIENQFKDINLKLQKPQKKKFRQNLSSIIANHTQPSVCNGNINQQDEQQKRIQEILQEIDALKGQVTQILKQKENMKKQKLNNSVTTNSSQPVIIKQKSNIKKIQNLQNNVSNLRKEFNSLRYQLDIIISKDQINAKLIQQNKLRPTIFKQNDPKEQFLQLSTKIQKIRAELMTFIKQLQLRLTEKQEETQLLHELQEKIHQHKLLINKKADQFQSDRYIKKLETRLNNFIKQTIAQQQYANTHDARIARQPWFCLSCDNQLKNYTGKQGKYLQKDILPGKKINPQNHMIRRSVKDLPEIK